MYLQGSLAKGQKVVVSEMTIGNTFETYDLSWNSYSDIRFSAQPRLKYSLSIGIPIENKFELFVNLSKMESPKTNFTIVPCSCNFQIDGPKYFSFGVEFRYLPVEWNRFTPYAGFGFSLNFLNDPNFGVGYMDSINHYQYFIANVGTSTAPLTKRGFQTLSLGIGVNWKLNDYFSIALQSAMAIVSSESSLHVINLHFESTLNENHVNDILYHKGYLASLSVGLRANLHKIKSSITDE
jgi:hypothetical protein